MLSTNSILRQGRYRIIEQFASSASFSLYDAYDNQLGNKVVIHETLPSDSKITALTEGDEVGTEFAERIKELKDIRHDGIVRVRDGFTELDRQYLVTEPVETRAAKQEFLSRPVETISRLLLALEFINKLEGGVSTLDLSPSLIRRTADGNNRLLYFGSANTTPANERQNLPYRSLESLWDGLDLASQKAISNGYDEASLDILESRADIRTAIYSLGASIYKILSDKSPIDALERSIEILDGRTDPLAEPNSFEPRIPKELSDFLLSCLQIKRENRFQTVAEARVALAIVPASSPSDESISVFDLDDNDLLEIPLAQVRLPLTNEAEPEVSLNQLFVNGPIDEAALLNEPEVKPYTVDEPALQVPSIFEEQAFEKPKTIRWAAGAVGGVVVLAGIVWGLLSFSSGNKVSDSDFNSGSSVMKEKQITNTQVQQAEPISQNKTEPTQAEIPVNKDSDQPQTTTRSRPVIADAKTPKRTESTPVAKPVEKPKKSVTVDDLINDN